MYIQVRYKTKLREKERKKHLTEIGEIFALENRELRRRRKEIMDSILELHRIGRPACIKMHRKLYWDKRVIESVLRSKYEITFF